MISAARHHVIFLDLAPAITFSTFIARSTPTLGCASMVRMVPVLPARSGDTSRANNMHLFAP